MSFVYYNWLLIIQTKDVSSKTNDINVRSLFNVVVYVGLAVGRYFIMRSIGDEKASSLEEVVLEDYIFINGD